ncbi:uncharacterized protein [Paralichthys olivaceus]|uniref:uncharacterized protein isoform X2 n=1 Tax=Paralichthys olivaceus TaxID=8255 RepID=UPI003753C365
MFGLLISTTAVNKVSATQDLQDLQARKDVFYLSADSSEHNHCDISPREHVCIPKQCESQCCCSVEMMMIPGVDQNVTVWRGDSGVESKIFNSQKSLKPRTPTIISVSESNTSFQVKWKTNMMDFISQTLNAVVIYHKKGETEKVTELFTPTTIGDLSSYTILGKDLKPSTTYLVSVKSYTDRSGLFSDRSDEFEFTTPAAPHNTNTLLLALVLSLSTAAVLIATAAFGCFVKVRRTWDNFPTPKLLIHPYAEELLKPQAPINSSVSVEPLIPDDSKSWSKRSLTDSSSGKLQQSSGIGSGSSCLSYANTEAPDILASVHDALSKAFPSISPVSPSISNLLNESNQASGLISVPCSPCEEKAVEVNSGSSDFFNESYSLFISSQPNQIRIDSSKVQNEAEMVCDSAYHPVEGNMVTCLDQRAPACPLLNLSLLGSHLMPTEMSYQQCNAYSGKLSYEEDSSLFSTSSGTDTTASCDPAPRVEAGYETHYEGASGMTKPNEEREGATICDDNTSQVPAVSHSCPPVGDAYQPFLTVVG